MPPSFSYRLALHAMQLDEEGRDVGEAGKWKQPVRAASTANVSIASGIEDGDTLDGVTLVGGDRVLLKDQTADEENGVYEVTDAAGIRTSDFDDGNDVPGAIFIVIAGTANGGKAYRAENTTAPVIDTDPITFAEFGGGGSVAELDDIGDVNAPSPTDGDLLTWDSTPGEWVASAPTGGGTITTKDEGSTLSSAVTTLDFTGAGVTASGAGATTTINIPGGGGGDPTIPSGGTLYDGTSTSGWTQHNSPDTFDVTTISDHFYLQETTMGGGNTVGVYRAVGGSFPRAYTIKINDGYMHANFHNPQLWVAEASPGKIVAWGSVRDGDAKYFQRQLWTNATTISTQTNFPGSTGTHALGYPMWLRLVVNSSTDIEGWHSYNGYIYYRFFSAYNPSFTVGSFGFGISAFAGIEMKMAVDWIHES